MVLGPDLMHFIAIDVAVPCVTGSPGSEAHLLLSRRRPSLLTAVSNVLLRELTFQERF